MDICEIHRFQDKSLLLGTSQTVFQWFRSSLNHVRTLCRICFTLNLVKKQRESSSIDDIHLFKLWYTLKQLNWTCIVRTSGFFVVYTWKFGKIERVGYVLGSNQVQGERICSCVQYFMISLRSWISLWCNIKVHI